MTEPKELIGVAVLIDKMFLRPQDRIVVEQSIEDVDRLADGAGNHLGGKHTVLVRRMGSLGSHGVLVPANGVGNYPFDVESQLGFSSDLEAGQLS